ncbi:hypothetical protein [Staphylococcus coagulans]|uniref:hypothetical protein n=1 Tax=Staphylococcus coagulans TaxID=74706 RepID=UPI001BEC2F58|nr:hypothetical protein [Staphylococcus coagulans]MBT2823067.1 hypothetical protein [Staphylococcus coagulans]MBT2834338.1 hypothetical protein [Staphylococcus coagulans]MBT2852398.1 hypothetical protein [Staphylococcus coagulans]MBT2864076.1 hypothetical protein [Staphylococcus coagulans]
MSEINVRYLKDNEGDKYYPVTHVDAIQGLDRLNWTPFSLNRPSLANTAFKDGDNGFDCTYKSVEIAGLKIKSIRLNATNLTNGQLLATLPNTLDLPINPHTFYIRTPSNRDQAIITIRADGTVYFYIKDVNWTVSDYIYGQYTWIE